MLFRNAHCAEPDVAGDGAGEQMRVLQNHAKIPKQRFEIELADVNSTNPNGSALNFIEAQQQAGERGLNRARMSDHRDRFARLNTETEIVKYPVLVFVCEPNSVEFDGGGCGRKGRWQRRRLNASRSIKQLENTFRRRHRGLQKVVFLAEILKPPEAALSILEESYQHTQCERAAADPESTERQQ